VNEEWSKEGEGRSKVDDCEETSKSKIMSREKG
jgi:hypothetical protein